MAARDKLVQIRTLRRQTNTQSSTGSGFFVSEDGLLITNYHVVSQLALEPERHRAVLVSVSGQEAPVQLLAIDVLHDLALLRVAPAKDSSAGAEGATEHRYSALPLRPSSRQGPPDLRTWTSTSSSRALPSSSIQLPGCSTCSGMRSQTATCVKLAFR